MVTIFNFTNGNIIVTSEPFLTSTEVISSHILKFLKKGRLRASRLCYWSPWHVEEDWSSSPLYHIMWWALHRPWWQRATKEVIQGLLEKSFGACHIDHPWWSTLTEHCQAWCLTTNNVVTSFKNNKYRKKNHNIKQLNPDQIFSCGRHDHSFLYRIDIISLFLIFNLVRFYRVSNLVGYLIPNALYTYILNMISKHFFLESKLIFFAFS